ncbi:MAG: hypothetical protein CM1200mP33_7290 [Chloroflexota bacterium]|nr:MAG: hypothetical protein CM1200mP33_7290 [Chloroflexota bacterium]
MFCKPRRIKRIKRKTKKVGENTKYDNRYRDYDPKLAEERSKTEPYVIRFKSPKKRDKKMLRSIRGKLYLTIKKWMIL